MKTIWLLLIIGISVSDTAALAQAGLKGEYFSGTNFEKKVTARIDSEIAFVWRGRSPVSGLGQSHFSVRWTGKLLAPASGKYVFTATVDDGIRVWVDNKKIVDLWPLLNDKGPRGDIVLEAGKYYDIRVEYFNDLEESFIMLLWQRPDELTALNETGKPTRTPAASVIDARYFYQTVPAAPKPVAVGSPPPSVAPATKPVAEIFENLETGKALVLQSVFFGQSTSVLLPASFPELDKLVRTLQQNPTVRIGIAGHTDNVGDPRLNQSLSEYRARVVMNYLTRHGIADSRVEAQGYGGSRPLTGNASESERARNRRVEFVVK